MARSVTSLRYSSFCYETADERAQDAGYADAAQMRGHQWLAKTARCACGRRGMQLRYFVGRDNAYPEVICERCWQERNGDRNGNGRE
ncbi:MAG: hypothetical protein ACE5JM_04735 [Armatimonadota bacterium]